MLTALNARTGAPISVYAYKALAPHDRPGALVCPGQSVEGAACTAPVTAAALDSDHVHPYFRVGRVSDHVEGCTEAAGDPPAHGPDTEPIGVDGAQGPRGPETIVRITLNNPAASAAAAAGAAPTGAAATAGHHRAPKPGGSDQPLTVRCGLRKAALDHARGVIADTDTVTLGTTTAPAREIIHPAERLINAPYNGHEVIAYGHLHSVRQGDKGRTHFIRLRLPDGRPTKVPIIISTAHYTRLRSRFTQVKQDPGSWTLIACGTIKGPEYAQRYLTPLGTGSIHFQHSSTASPLSGPSPSSAPEAPSR